MPEWVRQLKNLASHTKDSIVDFFKQATTPNPTIESVAQLVQHHEKTHVKRTELLGIVLWEYRLELNGVSFYLETKGEKSEYVLTFVISNKQEELLNFCSYKRDTKPTDKLSLPNDIFFPLI